MQVGTATGKVYINNQTGQVGIFPGRVRSGFVPLDHNITTTSTFRGVTHSMSVTPNGWTIGDRVDGQRFAAPAPSAAINNSFENAAVRALARNVVDGFHDGGTGLLQGIANTPSVIWNGLTDGAIRQATGGLYRGPNPFAAPLPFDPSNENARTASYMSAPPIAIPIGAGLAGGSIVNSSPLSLMPEQTSQLSPGAQMITDLVGQPGQATGTVNKAGDLVITGERFKFRVDFKNPGNDVPHMHLQELVDGDWVDAVDGVHRIRPKN
ncbi:MAG: hypothetical protein ABI999_04065 [Acidobacteriota bacterium]